METNHQLCFLRELVPFGVTFSATSRAASLEDFYAPCLGLASHQRFWQKSGERSAVPSAELFITFLLLLSLFRRFHLILTILPKTFKLLDLWTLFGREIAVNVLFCFSSWANEVWPFLLIRTFHASLVIQTWRSDPAQRNGSNSSYKMRYWVKEHSTESQVHQ